MPTSDRTIHLRRPPVLAMQDGIFVPEVDAAILADAEERWRCVVRCNPTAFDGRVCHVLGVHRNGHGGATIHAMDCAFRYYGAQDACFDLGVRPLGVKALVIRGREVLVGRRSPHAASYPGLWEFVPGGVVEPGKDPAAAVERELNEEAGLEAAAPPRAIAILYDNVARTWEVLYRVTPSEAAPIPSSEHECVIWTHLDVIGDGSTFSAVSKRLRCFLEQSTLATD